MNMFTLFVLLALPLSVSANTLLECHPRDGKFSVQDMVIGNVVIKPDEVILFLQMLPPETISFDVKKATVEVSQTGSWTTYVDEKEVDEMVTTLQIETSGKVRRAFLTRENSPLADEPVFEMIPMKCFEQP